jgi:hypothetical protein
MAKKTGATSAAAAKKAKAAPKKAKAAPKKAKAAPKKAKAGAKKTKAGTATRSTTTAAKPRGGAARPARQFATAPTIQIVDPANWATQARPFPVKCQATNVAMVEVGIARTGLSKAATLVGGFWQVTIDAGDISPTPDGQWDTLGAVGSSASGAATNDSVKNRIT